MATTVLVKKRGSVREVSINRPAFRNALDRRTIEALASALVKLRSDKDCRCIVLRGSGDEAFCAGADLRELAASDANGRRSFFAGIGRIIELIHTSPVPVVAMVHGFAMAGGCGIAAACDIVLAADDAIFGLPETAIGLVPMVVMGPIRRAVGHRALTELVLTAERIDATRAKEICLVSRVVGKKVLEKETEKLCALLCSRSPIALANAKEAMLTIDNEAYPAVLKTLADKGTFVSLGADAGEGITAFLEKRTPKWRRSK